MHTPLNTDNQFSIKLVASQSLHCKKILPFAPQLTLSHVTVNPHSNMPFASQLPLKIAIPQFVPNNLATNKSHSINKIAAKALQMSDSKECEHSD